MTEIRSFLKENVTTSIAGNIQLIMQGKEIRNEVYSMPCHEGKRQGTEYMDIDLDQARFTKGSTCGIATFPTTKAMPVLMRSPGIKGIRPASKTAMTFIFAPLMTCKM